MHNFETFEVTTGYGVFNFGRRRAAVREREAQLQQAEENVRRLKEEVSLQIEPGYNKVERPQIAAELVKLRTQGEQLQTQLARMLGRAESEQTIGRTAAL